MLMILDWHSARAELKFSKWLLVLTYHFIYCLWYTFTEILQNYQSWMQVQYSCPNNGNYIWEKINWIHSVEAEVLHRAICKIEPYQKPLTTWDDKNEFTFIKNRSYTVHIQSALTLTILNLLRNFKLSIILRLSRLVTFLHNDTVSAGKF